MSERERCLQCLRPAAHCLCGSISSIDHRTEILILQHPRERAHPFNTARIAERSLRRSRILVDRGGQLKSDATLAQQFEGFGLLYPGPDARDLSQIPKSEMPRGLVVIDGTWHHARAMYRDIQALRELPKFSIPQGEVSGFKIRKQPHEYCLSTLEAIHVALRCMEPDTPGLSKLLTPFHAMQEMQLALNHDPAPRMRKRPRSARGPELPSALRERFESLVVVYGELTPLTCEQRAAGERNRPLLTFAAERPATGERMVGVLDHDPLADERWPFFRLSALGAAHTLSIADLQQAWAAFQRPGDMLATWNAGTAAHIETTLPGRQPALVLKSLYCNHRPHRGTLDEIMEAEGLHGVDGRAEGREQGTRTEERLSNAVAIAKLLHVNGRDRQGAESRS